MPGKQGGSAGEGRQIPGRADQPERRSETALPDSPAIKGRITPATLPAGITTPGKCASHLGFGLGCGVVDAVADIPLSPAVGWGGESCLQFLAEVFSRYCSRPCRMSFYTSRVTMLGSPAWADPRSTAPHRTVAPVASTRVVRSPFSFGLGRASDRNLSGLVFYHGKFIVSQAHSAPPLVLVRFQV